MKIGEEKALSREEIVKMQLLKILIYRKGRLVIDHKG